MGEDAYNSLSQPPGLPTAAPLMNLILGVDAIVPPLTGIGHYALHLARGLRCRTDIADLRYFAGWRWLADPEQALAANQVLAVAQRRIPFKSLAFKLYQLARDAAFRWQSRSLRGYLFHAPNYILPTFADPGIATIHDLSHLRYPQFHPRERIAYLERRLPDTLRRAGCLISDSAFIRQEIITLLGVAPHRIHVAPLGVDPVFHPRSAVEIQPVLDRYRLAGVPYLLVVATLEPRKNLARTVAAYARLPAALRQRYPLALAGAPGWLSEDLERAIAPLERTGQARRLGYIPQDDLPMIYAGAFAFAYPSLYEGFGLPVLEALASGIPTLISDRASLPEVAGDAALYVDPEDVDDLSAGLERLLSDDVWRATTVAAGLQQAGRFSWERCIDQTVAAYRAALDA